MSRENLQIALLTESHFADSISVRKSPIEMVNLLLISSMNRSKPFCSERVSDLRLFMSISILTLTLVDEPHVEG